MRTLGHGNLDRYSLSAVVKPWLNVHLPIHYQPVRQAVCISDSQNISPFHIVFGLKMNELWILTIQTDFHTVCNRSPCTLLMSCYWEAPVHQQPASWFFKMLNDQLYTTFLPRYSHWINVGTWLIRTLWSGYIICIGIYKTNLWLLGIFHYHDYDFWRYELLWYRLQSAVMVDALVPHM